MRVIPEKIYKIKKAVITPIITAERLIGKHSQKTIKIYYKIQKKSMSLYKAVRAVLRLILAKLRKLSKDFNKH